MPPIYLDHAATTPVRPEVVDAMAPFAAGTYGNPSSHHRWGRAAADALEGARAEVAAALGARASEIRFVRGGTESDNLAILGSCRADRTDDGRGVPGKGRRHVTVVTTVEHSAVLEAAEYLESTGESELVMIGVSPRGTLDLARLSQAVADRPATVSVMWVNNETGLILPVADVVEAVRDESAARGTGVVVHSDASQAIGKVPVNLKNVPVDLLTGTGHKIYGPKGMGFLFVREGTRLAPLLHGGGQERALRPGTEDVAGAVGLATAIRLATAEQAAVAARFEVLQARLEAGLRACLPGVRVNCSEGPRAPHVSSVGLPGVSDGEAFLMALDLAGVAVSGGSACHSGAGKASHVIAALYGDADSMATVRYSFGRSTTDAEVDEAVRITGDLAARLNVAA